MDSVGKNIVDAQNTDESIRELCAQRQIYSEAKTMFSYYLALVVIIPVFISFGQILFSISSQTFSFIFAFYTIIAFILGIIIENHIKGLKRKGASIQEKLDCRLFGIGNNRVLTGEVPDHELIYKNCSEYTKYHSTEDLLKWYSPEIGEVKTNVAVLICQRTNCTYDVLYRQRFTYILAGIFTSIFILLLGICALVGLTLQNFVMNVILPLIPLLQACMSQIFQNNESISNLRELKQLIEAEITSIKIDDSLNPSFLRTIQDKIYLNRITSPLIPDKFFYHFRPKLEEQMHYGVLETINTIRGH